MSFAKSHDLFCFKLDLVSAQLLQPRLKRCLQGLQQRVACLVLVRGDVLFDGLSANLSGTTNKVICSWCEEEPGRVAPMQKLNEKD